MLEQVEHVLPENRSSISEYLNTASFFYARAILASANLVETHSIELHDLVRQRMEEVEARISNHLEARSYVVDAVQDVEFICGAGRIEGVSETVDWRQI